MSGVLTSQAEFFGAAAYAAVSQLPSVPGNSRP